MNKQQLQQEIEALQKQLEEKQKALAAMPEKWEPKGGDFFVGSRGEIHDGAPYSDDASESFGLVYATREQAEKAAKAMRAHNRLLAYVAEFAPDWEPDWSKGESKFYVYFDCIKMDYKYHYNTFTKDIGVVCMPENVAIELCRKLNSGEVEL